jgi:GNAT superfamily N-acetyltransferase
MNTLITEPTLAAESLMRNVLRGGRPIAEEYPLVFGAGAPGRVVSIGDADEVVSSCAILRRECVLPGGGFSAGLIGSVVTDPRHRGEGLAAEVLASAEAELAAQGCALALLWADDAAFYADKGYVPIGTELDYLVTPDLLPLLPDPDGVRAATADDHAAIHALYETHPERVERTAAETAQLLAGPGVEALVRTRDGAVIAYTCVGRGEDLQSVVHEWAGIAEDVLACVRAHLEARLATVQPNLFIMVPPTCKGLVHYFDITRTPGALGVLGMAKLLDRGAARDLLARYLPDGVSATVRGAEVVLAGPAGAVPMADDELLLALVAPKGDRQVLEVLERELGAQLGALPLTPFLWGFDSI